jgi:hypothetical protein
VTADPNLLGPLLFDALRKFNLEQGSPLTRSWREEARHTLLYASQDAAGLRTALTRESFTDVQLAVELQQIISTLTGLRDAIRSDSRET